MKDANATSETRGDGQEQFFEGLANILRRRSDILREEARLWSDTADFLDKNRSGFSAKHAGGESSVDRQGIHPPPACTQRPNLRPAEAAEFLGVSVQTLAKWRLTGEGPHFAKLGRRIVYRRQILEEFIEKRSHPHTSAYGNRR